MSHWAEDLSYLIHTETKRYIILVNPKLTIVRASPATPARGARAMGKMSLCKGSGNGRKVTTRPGG